MKKYLFKARFVVSTVSVNNIIWSGMLYLIFNNTHNESGENTEILEVPIIQLVFQISDLCYHDLALPMN